MATRQGHLEAQPGLRGHSVNPDDNKLKRFLVYIVLPLESGGGLLARTSFDNRWEAISYIADRSVSRNYIAVDNFTKTQRGTIVFSDWKVKDRFKVGEAL